MLNQRLLLWTFCIDRGFLCERLVDVLLVNRRYRHAYLIFHVYSHAVACQRRMILLLMTSKGEKLLSAFAESDSNIIKA